MYGATSARLIPDQKAGSSNLSALIAICVGRTAAVPGLPFFCCLLVVFGIAGASSELC